MALRTSPIICLFDSADIIVCFVNHCRRVSPREAIRLLGKTRRVEESESESEAKELNMGQWILSWLATVLGILQVAKLAFICGVPGTQTFGALYVVSYCIQAGIN
jgi:hypothetical protein